MHLTVDIEDPKSWPPSFTDKLAEQRLLILAFQRERIRIDRLGQDDIRWRIDPPRNEYKQRYLSLINELELLLAPHRLVAYHCTRLTPQEIASIKREGLRLLTPALIRTKMDQCYADGHLTRKTYDTLSSSQAIAECVTNGHGNRTGMIWFCPNRSTLQDYPGVHRFFRSWGGEAIYWGHEEDEQIAPRLRGIGTPCIVQCALPFTDAHQFHTNFSERFFAQYISDELNCAAPSASFDVRTKQNVEARDVIDIIEFNDPRFETLTNYRRWPERCQPNASAYQ